MLVGGVVGMLPNVAKALRTRIILTGNTADTRKIKMHTKLWLRTLMGDLDSWRLIILNWIFIKHFDDV
jgi:hypothetical protein